MVKDTDSGVKHTGLHLNLLPHHFLAMWFYASDIICLGFNSPLGQAWILMLPAYLHEAVGSRDTSRGLGTSDVCLEPWSPRTQDPHPFQTFLAPSGIVGKRAEGRLWTWPDGWRGEKEGRNHSRMTGAKPLQRGWHSRTLGSP